MTRRTLKQPNAGTKANLRRPRIRRGPESQYTRCGDRMSALYCSRCGSGDRVRIIGITWEQVHEDWPLCVACTKTLVEYLQPIFTDVIYRAKDTAFRGSTTLGHLSDFWKVPS